MITRYEDPVIQPGCKVLKTDLLYDVCIWTAPTSHSGYWRTLRGLEANDVWKHRDNGEHVTVLRGYKLFGRKE